MKKKLFLFALLTVCSVPVLSAKVNLTLDIGLVFTHFSNHFSRDNGTKSGRSANLGGVNILLRGEFAKNFGVYGSADFSFGQSFWSKSSGRRFYRADLHDANIVYAIDSQFGFFYAFKPAKNLEIMLGAGLGLGGNGHKREYLNKAGNTETEKIHCTNIGGGFNVDVSYMFTKMLGIYGGIADTFYAPVAVTYTKTSGKNNDVYASYSGSETAKAGVGRFSNSVRLKAGMQFKF